MFKYRFCTQEKYENLRKAWWTKTDGSWSQENIRIKIFGTLIAFSQHDMLSDKIDAPDMCWCASFK